MRLGVLDVGSNTVHLLIVDAYPGARPQPAVKHKTELRLSEMLDARSAVTKAGQDRLVDVCRRARLLAEDKGAQSIVAFATSALRESANGSQVLGRVSAEADVALKVLAGEEEARLTFLAVRRWYGWSSRRLLVMDIGGGSLEVASGIDEDPDVAVSLPLGAGRLTRDWMVQGSLQDARLAELRRHVRRELATVVGQVRRVGEPDHAVGTSKTFRSLARIAGAAPSSEGPYVRRVLKRSDAQSLVARLAAASPAQRSRLPGVSVGRAAQLLAGAVVADAALDLFEVDELEICPWALREGVILRQLDLLATDAEAAAAHSVVPSP